MDNESQIIQLLTEIRDNQKRQLDAHQKSQQDYLEFYKVAQARQNRRAVIFAVVIGMGMGLLILSLTMK